MLSFIYNIGQIKKRFIKVFYLFFVVPETRKIGEITKRRKDYTQKNGIILIE